LIRRAVGVVTLVVLVGICAPAAFGRVLLVGSYNGIRGQFRSVQAAVDAARSGDWILVGPGDYKERADHRADRGPQPANTPAGVVIAKAGLRLRGMNRNAVVIDGTQPGSPSCSARAADQDYGPAATNTTSGGYGSAPATAPLGRNGILVWKARNVWVQNLTVCNYLGGSGNAGNEVWWNGGDGSYKIGGHGFFGSYLSATSTFFKDEATAAQYGVFSSNWSGGTWDQIYASNFNDSGFYIGACQQVCDQTIDHGHSQYSALGYSGSNSGGRMLIEHSEFDHNKDGFDTNSQNGDNPPPQNGACPPGVKPPLAGAASCWVFAHNYVHDNNNPNVPYAGSAGSGPVGTGMSISGARNDTVMDNTFVHNGAWGVIIVPYPDSGPPCIGGTPGGLGAGSCLYDEWGDALLDNTFVGNGFYGHPTNGDFAQVNLENNHPTNCYRGNHEAGGASVKPASAAALQGAFPACNGRLVPAGSSDSKVLSEVLCNAQVHGTASACPTGQYPRRTRVIMHPLARQRTMADPCAGVPANPWCPARRGRRRR